MGRFSNIITSNKWDEKQNNIGEQSMQELPEDQIEHEMEAIDPSNKTTPYSIDEKQYNTKKKHGSLQGGAIADVNSINNSLTRLQVVSHETDINEDEEEAHYEDKHVKRALKQRHIGMIALGGTIGTGLFVGISTPLSNAGPVGSLIAYIFMGTIVYFVTQSLGEMATFIPVTSSITVFSKRFLSPAFGVSNGYMYWFNWAITYAVEVSVIGQVIEYWTDKVPLAAWIAIFWVIITLMNFFPVKVYGEFEFWVASVKVLAIMGYLIYALIIVCGGSHQGPIGFRYWRNPGAWGPGIISSDKSEGRFLGWVSSLINAAFTYQGTELVGITAGEAANPRKTVPRAINKVVFRIVLFYIMSLFFIGLLVPYNDSRLSASSAVIASSPFVISIQNAGTYALPDIFNAVVLITVVSAANSNVYVGSRVLYSLARTGNAPKQFGYVTRQGVPYLGVVCTAALGLLAFLVVNNNANTAFNWLINISTLAGLCAWLFISLAHIRFMQALKHRGISRDDLPFKAKLMPYGAYYAAFFVTVIIFIQGFQAFCPFKVSEFFTSYISLILLAVMFIGCQIYYKCRFIWKLEDIDIDSDRREIEAIIWEDDEPKNLWEKFWAAVA
ncbi:AAC_HP2_G0043260.mRNA.1.CDS.1 [Saccharomyces cerevisiae]|nr:AEL_HP2_G0042010.mRNA.1.CDS.1 [Saccharomyces cerevisiae]CAI5319128.1 AAC_HP2_G0043260.mRNA.1.CDS.1 [Saccharomyces cerevisiae]CAI6680098.1 AEL_HP2_G0042010.mRNA.1.CDS.1 [Saccharomyces cerevisiae]CAI6720654.1 AAC_HP2_G0043260.mRNA.1.CDS.1 [Saccharomyces cerevisiae]CAI6725943.1 AEL_HP1_G0044130.mRNA.1.CDS.1 [Saccharomyces cerevisiae]